MMQQQSPSPQPQGRGSRKQLCYTPMRPLFSGGVDYHHFAAAENRICSPKQELQEAVVIPPALKRKSGMAYCGAESAEQNVGPGSSFVINGPQRTPVSGKAGKTQKVPRTPKAKAFSHTLVEVGSPAGSPSASCRYDSSLGLLTKKFINLIKRAEDGIIDLNNAADTLEVQKRRIYDITNVLEGIGLIEKTLKNRIQWKGMDVLRPGEDDESLSDLKEEIRNLNMEESSLDERIRQMQQNLSGLSEDEDNEKWLFVTEEDIKNLPCFQNETLIAIKAPHGTTLEVPDPDEAVDYPQRRYRIVLRSTMGPIDVYLVSQFEEKFEEMNAVEPQPTILETSTVDETTVAPPPIPGVTGNELNVQGVDAQRMYLPTSTSQDFVGGITKIVPDVDSDADYWLMADANVSITDMWLNESEVDWNTLNTLQEDYMSISPPQPQPQPQPQSPHPSRVSSVSNTNTGA